MLEEMPNIRRVFYHVSKIHSLYKISVSQTIADNICVKYIYHMDSMVQKRLCGKSLNNYSSQPIQVYILNRSTVQFVRNFWSLLKYLLKMSISKVRLGMRTGQSWYGSLGCV